MSFKRRAGSSPALGTEKASPKPGEAFLSGGNTPNKENRVNILLVNHINQLQNTEIIHFQHCEIQNNSYLCDIIVGKTTLLRKQGRYLSLKWVPAFSF